MPTLIWCDGFEYGLAPPRLADTTLAGEIYEQANASGTGSAIAPQSGSLQSGSGSRFMRLTVGTGAGAYTYLNKILSSGAGRFGVMSFIFRPDIVAPLNDTIFAALGNLATTTAEFAVRTTGALGIRARHADSYTNMTGFTFTANHVYKVDVWVDYGASGTVTYSTKIQVTDLTTSTVYGPQTVNAAGTNTAATVDTFVLEADAGGNNLTTAPNHDFDDWAISQTSADFPLASFEVLGAPITAVGTHSFTAGDFKKSSTGSTTGNNVDQPETAGSDGLSNTLIDEIPWSSSDTDWVWQAVIRSTGYLEYTKNAISGSDPWGVMLAVQVKLATGTNASSVIAKLSLSGTDSALINTTHAASATRAFKAGFSATKPGGGAWTVTDFNNTTLRWGYATDVTNNQQLLAMLLQYAVPISGVTSVSKDLASSYTVRQQIAKTLSPSYTVKVTVAKTASASYTVKAFVSKTVSPSYNVIVRVAKVLSSSYSIGAVPANTVAPSISGQPLSGQTLTADHGTWTNSPTSYSYQWQVEDAPGSGTYSDIPGETGSTLNL